MSNELIYKAFEAFVNKDEAKAKELIHEFAVRRGKAILVEAWEKDEELTEFGDDYDESVKNDIIDSQDEIESEMNGLSEDEDFDDLADEEGLADRVMDLEQEHEEVGEKVDVVIDTLQSMQDEFKKAIEAITSAESFEDESELEDVAELEDTEEELEDVASDVDFDEENLEDVSEMESNESEFDDDDASELEESIEFHKVSVEKTKSPSVKSPVSDGKCDVCPKDAEMGVSKSKSEGSNNVKVVTKDRKNTHKSSKEIMKPVRK